MKKFKIKNNATYRRKFSKLKSIIRTQLGENIINKTFVETNEIVSNEFLNNTILASDINYFIKLELLTSKL
jgi:hypothetical protein